MGKPLIFGPPISGQIAESIPKSEKYPVNSLLTGDATESPPAKRTLLRRSHNPGPDYGFRSVSVHGIGLHPPEMSGEFRAVPVRGNETGLGGGGGGIRTHGTLSRTPVFKTSAFDHSATPPVGPYYPSHSDSERRILSSRQHSSAPYCLSVAYRFSWSIVQDTLAPIETGREHG